MKKIETKAIVDMYRKGEFRKLFCFGWQITCLGEGSARGDWKLRGTMTAYNAT